MNKLLKINRIQYIILPFLMIFCTSAICQNSDTKIKNNSDFTIINDTVCINVKGRMTHALKYQEKYFVLFEEIVKWGYAKRLLYVISDGEIERVIDCPSKMHTTYLDFFVNNEIIYLKPYMNDIFYRLNLKNYNWEEIKEVKDLIYEDNNYYVYALDFGEWGAKTWFISKKTDKEYLIEAETPLINKIDSIYYLSTPNAVFKINNPLQLNICDQDVTYENIEKTKKCYTWYGEPIGFEVVYVDTLYNYFEYNFQPNIVTSFVKDNELLHIYETVNETFIAKSNKFSIQKIQKIGDQQRFYRDSHSYRFRNTSKKNELLLFETRDPQCTGLMDLLNNEIITTYIWNGTAIQEKQLPSKTVDSIMFNRLDLIFENYEKLFLKDIKIHEQQWYSFDITPPNMGIGDCYNPRKFKIDAWKAYSIKEDSTFIISIDYYATKETDLVRAVFIEWSEFDFFTSTPTEYFINKHKLLEDYLTKKFGNFSEIKYLENLDEKIWKTSNGLTIILENFKSFNKIELTIYSN